MIFIYENPTLQQLTNSVRRDRYTLHCSKHAEPFTVIATTVGTHILFDYEFSGHAPYLPGVSPPQLRRMAHVAAKSFRAIARYLQKHAALSAIRMKWR